MDELVRSIDAMSRSVGMQLYMHRIGGMTVSWLPDNCVYFWLNMFCLHCMFMFIKVTNCCQATMTLSLP